MSDVIVNPIFEHYRKKKKKLNKAILLLKKNNFVVYEKGQKNNVR